MPSLSKGTWALLVAVPLVLIALGIGLTIYALRERPEPELPPNTVAKSDVPTKDSNNTVKVPTNRPPKAKGLGLIEQTNTVDLSDDRKPVNPVLFFTLPDEPTYDMKGLGGMTGLLRRELYRQGMILAAREEMGLLPRDAQLGEAAPMDIPVNNTLSVHASFPLIRKYEVRLDVGPNAGLRTVWHGVSPDSAIEFQKPLDAVTNAEQYSRTLFVNALKRAGLHGTAIPLQTTAVPEAIERLLGRMNFIDQYSAIRQLHELTQAKGQSPATLAALARAYAHLGMLTDRQWDTMTWVFKARSLLYAERLRQQQPEAPEGRWIRAYAAAFAGMHQTALADIQASNELATQRPSPAWLPLIEALCRFDYAKLTTVEGEHHELAKVLAFLTVESLTGAKRGLEAGRAAMEANPECYRVLEGMIDMGGVSSQHTTTLIGYRTFSKTFADHVAQVPKLPASVTLLAKPETPEAELVNELLAAGTAAQEQGYPSCAVIARFAQETRFLQVKARTRFLKNLLVVPIDEYLDEHRPVIEQHPYVGYVDSLRVDAVSDPAKYAAKIQASKPRALTYRHGQWMEAYDKTNPQEAKFLTNIVTSHGERMYCDAYLLLRLVDAKLNASPIAKDILVVCPHCPLARAQVIAHDWKTAAPLANQWYKEAQHPEIFVAFGRHYMAEQKVDLAIESYEQAVKLSPDGAVYQELADIYKRRNNMDQWVATMEKFINEPGGGLDKDKARVAIANYYIAKQDFKRAKPYADEAAESWAAWALLCSSQCNERLEQWDISEQMAQRLSVRYPGSSYYYWWCWCLRTGRGDEPAARKMVEDHVQRLVTPRLVQDIMMMGVLDMLQGKRAEAAGRLLTLKQGNDPIVPMIVALEYEALKDATNRDHAFGMVKEAGSLAATHQLLKECLAKGPTYLPKRDDVETLIDKINDGNRFDASYLFGRLFQIRGDAEFADKLFRFTRLAPNGMSLTSVLGGVMLREKPKK